MAGLKLMGYDFDYEEFHASMHGKLPYEKLKPDPVLRNLLLSMPQNPSDVSCYITSARGL